MTLPLEGGERGTPWESRRKKERSLEGRKSGCWRSGSCEEFVGRLRSGSFGLDFCFWGVAETGSDILDPSSCEENPFSEEQENADEDKSETE